MVPEIMLFAHGREDFLRRIEDAGARYRWNVDPAGGSAILASALPLEIIGVSAGAIVAIVRGWLSARAARMAHVKLADGTTVTTQGMSADETDKVLAAAVRITLIQTQPDAPGVPLSHGGKGQPR